MTQYIRGRCWDSAWILSGVPIGFLLLAVSMWVASRDILLFSVGVIGTAHLVAPICLAWGRQDIRAIALRWPARFIGIPLGLLGSCAVVGYVASGMPSVTGPDFTSIIAARTLDYWNPLVILAMVYVVWNAYHFGMQNFGVLNIYRVKRGGNGDQRIWDKTFCLVNIAAATALPFVPHLPFAPYLFRPMQWGLVALTCGGVAVMLAREGMRDFSLPRVVFIVATAMGPFLLLWWGFFDSKLHHQLPWFPFWPAVFGFAIITTNHYLASIGIAGHVFSRHRGGSFPMFVAAVLVVGAALFATLFVDLRTWALHITAITVSLRIGLGFVHFLYDRWLYKLSDPRVRATIGQDVLSLNNAASRA